jgi:hypothetical protein
VTGTLQPLPLVFDDADIDHKTRAAVLAAQQGVRVLGDSRAGQSSANSPERLLLDALPALIARKIERILPPDFEIAELEFCFTLEGKLMGSGMKGEVKAKLRPGNKLRPG